MDVPRGHWAHMAVHCGKSRPFLPVQLSSDPEFQIRETGGIWSPANFNNRTIQISIECFSSQLAFSCPSPQRRNIRMSRTAQTTHHAPSQVVQHLRAPRRHVHWIDEKGTTAQPPDGRPGCRFSAGTSRVVQPVQRARLRCGPKPASSQLPLACWCHRLAGPEERASNIQDSTTRRSARRSAIVIDHSITKPSGSRIAIQL
jgi:hypothetical protein